MMGQPHAMLRSVSSITNGDIVTFDAQGNIVDSVKKIETSLSTSSDSKVPTSKAVATHVTSAIATKANKVSSTTADHFVSFSDTKGTLKDSGKSASDFSKVVAVTGQASGTALTGLKVDGTSYTIPQGGGSAGVSSIGGATGAITLGNGLSINGQTLNSDSTNIDSINYQSYSSVGTYPRIFKRNGTNELYLWSDYLYKKSTNNGKTWSNYVKVCDYENSYENVDKSGNALSFSFVKGDLANAFGFNLPDGRIGVVYRGNNKENSYFSIRCRISELDGTFDLNTNPYVLLESTSTSDNKFQFFEPVVYDDGWSQSGTNYINYLFCSRIFGLDDNPGVRQDISRYQLTFNLSASPITIATGEVKTFISGSSGPVKVGMVSMSKVVGSSGVADGYIAVVENTRYYNASNRRPMVVQYAYSENPFATNIAGIGQGSLKTLFEGTDKYYSAPFVTTLPDWRLLVSFQTDENYSGTVTPTTNWRRQRFVAYISKKRVIVDTDTSTTPETKSISLSADDFEKVNVFDYNLNEYGAWGSVSYIEGNVYFAFSQGVNISESDSNSKILINIVPVLPQDIEIPASPVAFGTSSQPSIVLNNGENTASAKGSAAIGVKKSGQSNTTASGTGSFAGGVSTSAASEASFAFGRPNSNNVITESTQTGAVAFGTACKARRQNSFVAGLALQTVEDTSTSKPQAVFGKYNADLNDEDLFAVGNGTKETSRKTAFSVNSSGDAYVQGILSSLTEIFVDFGNVALTSVSTTIGQKLYNAFTKYGFAITTGGTHSNGAMNGDMPNQIITPYSSTNSSFNFRVQFVPQGSATIQVDTGTYYVVDSTGKITSNS